ncbi:hypothetical protein ACOMHN_004565 [Nucella lapillus]
MNGLCPSLPPSRTCCGPTRHQRRQKDTVINGELLRLQVDITALQETRLAGSGILKEKGYTFFWQGKSAEECREQGVGFAVWNFLLKMVEPGDKGCEHLLTLRLHTSDGPVTLHRARLRLTTKPPMKRKRPQAKSCRSTSSMDVRRNSRTNYWESV